MCAFDKYYRQSDFIWHRTRFKVIHKVILEVSQQHVIVDVEFDTMYRIMSLSPNKGKIWTAKFTFIPIKNLNTFKWVSSQYSITNDMIPLRLTSILDSDFVPILLTALNS